MRKIWVVFLLICLGGSIILVCKLGNRYPSASHPLHMKSWNDGQIVDILPDEAHIGLMVRKNFACIRVNDPLNWKDDDVRKLVHPPDKAGKFPWDSFYDETKVLKKRGFHVDLKHLVDQGYMTESKKSDIYNKALSVGVVNTKVPASSILRVEGVHPRLDPSRVLVPGSISSGDFEVGSGADYDTVPLFEADIAATLTGILRGLHRSEITACGSAVSFAVDTSTYSLVLTAKPGAETTGVWGNGGIIDLVGFDKIGFTGDCVDGEISKLSINAEDSSNTGITFTDLTNAGGTIKVFRMLIKGNVTATAGIYLYQGLIGNTYYLYNNIIYGFTKDPAVAWTNGRGLAFHGQYASHAGTFYVYNNTIAKCQRNFSIFHVNAVGTHTWKNNFGQGPVVADYTNADQTGTHGTNISEDATSPDAAYRNLDKHTKFQDYANDKYRVTNQDNNINDGENLSAVFNHDICGCLRSDPWYIGASQYAEAAMDGKKNYKHWYI